MLRTARVAQGMSQEALEGATSSRYVRMLERGDRAPSLAIVEEIASALGVHPLTMLALCYVQSPTGTSVSPLLRQVMEEVEGLNVREFSSATLQGGRSKKNPAETAD